MEASVVRIGWVQTRALCLRITHTNTQPAPDIDMAFVHMGFLMRRSLLA